MGLDYEDLIGSLWAREETRRKSEVWSRCIGGRDPGGPASMVCELGLRLDEQLELSGGLVLGFYYYTSFNQNF